MVLKEDQSKLSNIQSALKTVNIYKFSKTMLVDHLSPLLEKAISEGHNNIFYESMLAEIINKNALAVEAMVVSPKKWVEIDNHEDLIEAQNIFSELH